MSHVQRIMARLTSVGMTVGQGKDCSPIAELGRMIREAEKAAWHEGWKTAIKTTGIRREGGCRD